MGLFNVVEKQDRPVNQRIKAIVCAVHAGAFVLKDCPRSE